MEIFLACSQQDHPIYEVVFSPRFALFNILYSTWKEVTGRNPTQNDEPIDKSKLWGDLEEEEEEEQEEEMDEEELEDGMESVYTLSRYCFALNSERSFQLAPRHRMQLKRKESDRPLYQVDLLRGAKDRWISVYWRPWRMFYLPSK
ncbi:hypothetical protein YC2023_087140 [Brassica napus]